MKTITTNILLLTSLLGAFMFPDLRSVTSSSNDGPLDTVVKERSDSTPAALSTSKDKPLKYHGPYETVGKSVGILTYDFGKKKFHFITDPTDSFTEVVKLATKEPNSILIDRHFNAGGGFGYLTIPNPKAKNFAKLLNAEYEKIYKAKGWQRSSYNLDTSKTNKFTLLRQAQARGIAAVIDEFGFMDDSKNGSAVIDWMKTREGQTEIGNATIRAGLDSEFDNIYLSAGHWGPRGFSGASHKGFHETEYSFNVFTAMVNSIKTDNIACHVCMDPEPNRVTTNLPVIENSKLVPSWGYTSDKELTPETQTKSKPKRRS